MWAGGAKVRKKLLLRAPYLRILGRRHEGATGDRCARIDDRRGGWMSKSVCRLRDAASARGASALRVGAGGT